MSSIPTPPPPSGSGDQQPHEPPRQPEPTFPQPPPEQPYQQQPYPGQQGPPQYAGTGAPYSSQGGRQLSPSEERTWAVLAHLSAPIAFVLSAGFLSFVGPLLIWAIYKDRSPMVRNASAGAFNFNLTTWLVYVLGAVVGLIVTLLTLGLALFVFIPLAIVVFIVAAVLHIVGAVKASNGEPYTYPLQLPVLK